MIGTKPGASTFDHAFELNAFVQAWNLSDDEAYAATYERAAREAADEIAPFVGKCLQDNWRKTGLGDTGKMLELLGRTEVWAKVKGKRIFLTMRMSRFADDYTYKGTRKSAYVVAGALNYGAVRMPKEGREIVDTVTGAITGYEMRAPVGSKGKRTIKAIALKGSAGAAREKALREGYVRHAGQSTERRLTRGYDVGGVVHARETSMGTTVHFGGGAVVIPPKQFFFLSTMQLQAVGQAFLKIFSRILQERSSYASR